MLELSNLLMIGYEPVKDMVKPLGGDEHGKIYQVSYCSQSYYVDKDYTRLFTVYNEDFSDYDEEVLDLNTSRVLRLLVKRINQEEGC